MVGIFPIWPSKAVARRDDGALPVGHLIRSRAFSVAAAALLALWEPAGEHRPAEGLGSS